MAVLPLGHGKWPFDRGITDGNAIAAATPSATHAILLSSAANPICERICACVEARRRPGRLAAAPVISWPLIQSHASQMFTIIYLNDLPILTGKAAASR